MTKRMPLVTGNIYHVFNRGVNKTPIFFAENDYSRFLDAAVHYLSKNTKYTYEKQKLSDNDETGSSESAPAPKVEVLAYCLMPNHFHFLVKQFEDGGITSYFRRLANSYAHFINLKYKRVGPLFQGRFKTVSVETDEQLLHLSRYIHLNPMVSGLVSSLENYHWSSYMVHTGKRHDQLCQPKMIKDFFKSSIDYEKFVLDRVSYAKTLDKIKHAAFDHE